MINDNDFDKFWEEYLEREFKGVKLTRQSARTIITKGMERFGDVTTITPNAMLTKEDVKALEEVHELLGIGNFISPAGVKILRGALKEVVIKLGGFKPKVYRYIGECPHAKHSYRGPEFQHPNPSASRILNCEIDGDEFEAKLIEVKK